ncbi:hypothetical protein J2S09_004773 [Bacillus fengqiuensis]|nr:hypothetical protein [Bacillus fengqiuensis]
MRIERAATPEIEAYIEDLKTQILYEIIPRYFSSQELKKIEKLQLLNPDYALNASYNGLLKEALQIISSLQALVTVIENVRYRDIQQHHRMLFNRNVETLDKYGFSFPLTIDQFSKEKCQINMYYDHLSSYSFAVN